ncbi:MAG TPA: mobile mystery protein A, partial [Chitinophagales bacterium]|nr:mobile mystery protein A [Chitinophagales bacterium]
IHHVMPLHMNKKSLLIQQLSRKMTVFGSIQQTAVPPSGWIRTIRNALGMSLQQLGKKLSITRQSVQEMEQREQDGTITLKSLKEVAKAMDMQLVYAFVPVDGTLEDLIERKATALARQIVMRTSNSMKLEDQQNSTERLEKAIQERANAIKNEMPKILWD